MLSEVYKYLEKSESIYDFADAVVVVRLRTTLDLCKKEVELLTRLKNLSSAQREDLEELTGDIEAIERVINFYSWVDEDE